MPKPFYLSRSIMFHPRLDTGLGLVRGKQAAVCTGEPIRIPSDHSVYVERWQGDRALCSATWHGQELHAWLDPHDYHEADVDDPSQTLSCFI